LPGSLQEQGYGNDVDIHTKWTVEQMGRTWYNAPEYDKYRQSGNIKLPFWLTPKKHYVGAAWYQREINIPKHWADKSVLLELERTHWETALFIDGNRVGNLNSLSTPHRYELKGLKSGKHILTLRVDNRVHIPVGIDAHSVSDHTQSNWNGIIGNISLTVKPAVYINDVQIYPDVTKRQAEVRVVLSGKGKVGDSLSLQLETITGEPVGKPVSVDIGAETSFILNLTASEDIALWSEYHPNLYRLKTVLRTGDETDVRQTTFGFREFKREGTRFHINGQPTFLRGTLECCIFPLTGYPAMDKSYWEKIYGTCKAFGLNHVRFHSWCPPEAAFAVADSMGIYLQIECAAWATVGNGSPLDQWIRDESDRILKEYGNHPSFCMLTYGNEPSGKNQGAYLSSLVEYWKTKDRRRVYSSAAGWPYIKNADYWSTPDPRGQAWNAGGATVLNTQKPCTDYDWRKRIRNDMPTVSHEIGQWCVYPNFKEIDKYTGVLKARNFEIFRETLEAAHLGDLSDEFLFASGKLQTLCYKAEIEAALRTPKFAGFQLLGLHDFPGQGVALVGVLDPFWDTKGYVTGEEYSRFCNQTVPLVRFQKLIWQNDETLKASVEIAHFGEQPLTNTKILWNITDSEGGQIAAGTFFKETIPLDNCTEAGVIEFPLRSIGKAKQLAVSLSVSGTPFRNQWNIWVYPSQKATIASQPFIASKWNENVISHLNSGESVLLTLPKGSVRPEAGGNIAVGFSPIFWSTALFPNHASQTLGVYCDPKHPALASFPNEGFSDYQWWDIVTNCNAINMKDFPADFRPIIHLIDDWFKNRKLGILFEAKVGKGKLMVCSADLQTNLANRPAAAQFRQSLLEYMASDKFNPNKEIDPKIIGNLLINK
jgi:hypothetical protein